METERAKKREKYLSVKEKSISLTFLETGQKNSKYRNLFFAPKKWK